MLRSARTAASVRPAIPARLRSSSMKALPRASSLFLWRSTQGRRMPQITNTPPAPCNFSRELQNVIVQDNNEKGEAVMSEYVFLYRGGEHGASPEVMQQRMQKWLSWMKELGEVGRLKDRGHPLERAGKLVKGKQKAVTDGPFAEAKDAMGSFNPIGARERGQGGGVYRGGLIFDRRHRSGRGRAGMQK